MVELAHCSAIEQDPEKVSGALVFRGTRVPFSTLFENLRDGATRQQFLDWFPGVERWQVESVLVVAEMISFHTQNPDKVQSAIGALKDFQKTQSLGEPSLRTILQEARKH